MPNLIQVASTDCGLDGAWRSVLDTWGKVEGNACLFLMAATAWDFMLTPDETTKKQRGIDFAELKKSVGTIRLCVCLFVCLFVHLFVSVTLCAIICFFEL